MGIPFVKISGAGNDFIIIDNRKNVLAALTLPDFARNVCRRRESVGADGLILVENSNRLSARMRMFNADGTTSEMSGNGARAFASYVHTKGIVQEDSFRFETSGGDVETEIEAEAICLRLSPPNNIQLSQTIVANGKEYTIHCIEVQGTPHGVIFWADVHNIAYDTLIELGREMRYHSLFNRGANINFTEVLDKNTLRVRTYERGVEDETLACGTGSTGAAVIGFLLGKVESPVKIKTSSGQLLEVTWSGSDVRTASLYLRGSVQHIVDGVILPDAYVI